MEWGRNAMGSYLAEAVKKRRKDRGTDLISTLIEAEEEGEKLSEAEIIGVCQLLLLAGNVIGERAAEALQSDHRLGTS